MSVFVYVAGPYIGGDVAQNVRRAIQVGDALIAGGFVPHIPHLSHFMHILLPRPYEDWVMTPPAKAGGFSGDAPLDVDACRSHPGRESAFENVSRCVLVSMQGESAVRANVLAYRQGLLYDGTAPAALLARAPCIHSHNLATGTRSLVGEDVHEAAPGGIGDRASKAEPAQRAAEAYCQPADREVVGREAVTAIDLAAENKRLRAENERLREGIDRIKFMLSKITVESERLHAELEAMYEKESKARAENREANAH